MYSSRGRRTEACWCLDVKLVVWIQLIVIDNFCSADLFSYYILYVIGALFVCRTVKLHLLNSSFISQFSSTYPRLVLRAAAKAQKPRPPSCQLLWEDPCFVAWICPGHPSQVDMLRERLTWRWITIDPSIDY